MATLYSDQLTVANAVGNGKNSGLIDEGGKVRVLFFSFLTTGSAQNDTVDLGYLPKNARILDGSLISEALGTSVTLSVGTDVGLVTGTSDTAIAAGAANLLAATSHASAANSALAATYALGAGSRTTARTKVYATIGGANPTTAKQVQGWVRYLAN